MSKPIHKNSKKPLPIFDTLNHLQDPLPCPSPASGRGEFGTPTPASGRGEFGTPSPTAWEGGMMKDYFHATQFLKAYRGSEATFNAYRRELERLLQWSWWIANKNITQLKRTDIEAFIEFCQKPPLSWI